MTQSQKSTKLPTNQSGASITKEQARDGAEILDISTYKFTKRDKYATINLTMLNTFLVAGHKDFQMLKKELEIWNVDVRKALDENTSLNNYQWKHTLYEGLRNFLLQAAGTENDTLRETFIQKAKTWYNDKIDKKLGVAPANTSMNTTVRKSTRPNSDISRLSPIKGLGGEQDASFLNASLLNNEMPNQDQNEQGSFFGEGISEILPSRYREEVLRDYEEGRRSLHGTVEPPYERILEFGRKAPKGILHPISKQKAKKAMANTRTSIPKLQEAAIASSIRDEGILSNLSSARIAEQTSQKEDDDSEKEDKEDKEEGGEDGEGGEEGEGAEGGEEGEEGKGGKKVSIMAPARKLFVDDNLTRKSVDTRDQFIPMEYRSANSHYVSSGEPYELALEKRWRDSMNKKIVERRERQEFVGHMKQWSYAKAHFEQERVRRGESINFGSLFEKRAFQRRANSNIVARNSVGGAPDQDITLDLTENNGIPLNRHSSVRSQQSSPVKVSSLTVYHENGNKDVTMPKIVDFSSVRHRRLKSGGEGVGRNARLSISEADISKQKIANIKKLHENLLFSVRGASDDFQADDSDLVNRPVSLSVYDHTKMKNYTPFSVVTQRNDSDALADKQIREVHDLKKKLANIKMKVTIKALENSILLPSLTAKNQDNPLPIPGCKLLMNPFHKERKARGKKKKR